MKFESAIKKINKKKKMGWHCEVAQHRQNPYRANIRFYKQDEVSRWYDDDEEIYDLGLNDKDWQRINKKCSCRKGWVE
jgi:hypothetical protein